MTIHFTNQCLATIVAACTGLVVSSVVAGTLAVTKRMPFWRDIHYEADKFGRFFDVWGRRIPDLEVTTVGEAGLDALQAGVLGFGGALAAGTLAYEGARGIKSEYQKYKAKRQFWRGLKYGYGNPNVARKLFNDDTLPSVDPSSAGQSSISNMEPYSRDGGSWYQTRPRRVGRRKPISSSKITRALTEMQTFKLGCVSDYTTGVTSVTDNQSKVGLYGEWDPGRPCLINLENTAELLTYNELNATAVHYTPMHLYDLSWAPVQTNRGAAGGEATDHYDPAAPTLNPENISNVWKFNGNAVNGVSNTWNCFATVGGISVPMALHKSTDDDDYNDITLNDTFDAVTKYNCQQIRWIETAHKNGPPSFQETYGSKVYNKSLTIKYNVAGCRSTPTKVELRVIKLNTPWMHPSYSTEFGARGTEEQSFYLAEWSRMIRGMCINPLARGELPQPVPGMKHKWFRTLAKKVINFPEASADRGTIPMVSGQFHININQLQDHAWKQSGRGDNLGYSAYDSTATVNQLDFGTFALSQRPWFTNRILLLVRAVVPHQFILKRNMRQTERDTVDTNIGQTDDLEGNGMRYETGNPADTSNAMDGDLNNDGNFNQLDYNEYLKNFCPSYELNITKSFVSINDYMGLPTGGYTTSAH